MKSYGFSLVELLITMAIIAIIGSVLYASFFQGENIAGDAERKAALLQVKNALEQYRADYGRYPVGCNSAGTWSGQAGSSFECASGDNNYISGLIPNYLQSLPFDSDLPVDDSGSERSDAGFRYVTNGKGSVYKFMALNTVESEAVTETHRFASCNMQVVEIGSFGPEKLCVNDLSNSGSQRDECTNGNDQFATSYGVYDGFARTGASTDNIIENTQKIVCKP